jgi:hypothetical protein
MAEFEGEGAKDIGQLLSRSSLRSEVGPRCQPSVASDAGSPTTSSIIGGDFAGICRSTINELGKPSQQATYGLGRPGCAKPGRCLGKVGIRQKRLRSAKWSLSQVSKPVTTADRRCPLIEGYGLTGDGGRQRRFTARGLWPQPQGPTPRCRQPLSRRCLRAARWAALRPVGWGKIGSCGLSGSRNGPALRGRRAARRLEGSRVREVSGKGHLTNRSSRMPIAAIFESRLASEVGL